MSRIQIIDRSNMNDDQARVYDKAKAAGNPVGGPYYAYIYLPKIFEAAQGLRASLATGPLSPRETQIVNLMVARHFGALYPWFAQVRASLAVGISEQVIDAINAKQTPSLPDAREAVCHATARELLESKGLSDQAYATAQKALGLEGLIALTATTGSFSMTCLTANTFGIQPPADNPIPLATS
jgi:hypothetical protein